MDAIAPLAPPVALRVLRADEAPYPGVLRAGEPPAVWVDIEQLPPEVWSADADGHVLAPVDVARADTGHAALVPHCPERLGAGIGAGRARCTPGQTITIAISLLRGAVQARELGAEMGSWWLDADRRPVLALTQSGTRRWEDETIAVLTGLQLSAGPRLSAALAQTAAVISDARLSAAPISAVLVQECEDALFEVGESEPLRAVSAATADAAGDGLSPLPAEVVSQRGESRHRAQDRGRARGPAEGESVTVARTRPVAGLEIGRRLADVGLIVRGLPARLRGRAGQRPHQGTPADAVPEQHGQHRRRAPLLVAGGVGALVLAAGLWWPNGEVVADATAPGTSGATMPSAVSTTPAADAHPSSGVSGDDTAGGGDETVAQAALTALATCIRAEAEQCPAAMENTTAALPDGVVGAQDAQRTVTLLDEYGGVSVYRVEADGFAAQVMVLVAVDEKWLIREVYDLADQP
ncbi:MAG: hypothetical protein QM622_04730 [Microbacterium sp.]